MELREAIEALTREVKISNHPFDRQVLMWLLELQTFRESEQEYIGEEDELKSKELLDKFEKLLNSGFKIFMINKDIKIRGMDIKKGTIVKLKEYYNDTAPLFEIIPIKEYAYIDVGILEPVEI